MIPTRVHGVLDYLLGVLLIGAGLYWYQQDAAAGAVPIVLGAGAILYSLATAYELGAVRVIPMKGHLALDVMSGLLLAASPWLFGFADYVWLPHVGLGLTEVAAAAATARVSPVEQRRGVGSARAVGTGAIR